MQWPRLAAARRPPFRYIPEHAAPRHAANPGPRVAVIASLACLGVLAFVATQAPELHAGSNHSAVGSIADAFADAGNTDDGFAIPGVGRVASKLTTATGGQVVESSSAVPAPGQTIPATAVEVSDLAANGIPTVALAAYQQGAAQYDAVARGCNLTWPLLAAIGRVESDHGRVGGATLHTDGTSSPKIIGRALDGNGTATITATPLGITLDGDPHFDHAIGPMQIIPSTWASYATAAKGHTTADPFNIYDAAVSAARYLCAAGGDLSNPTARQVAVFSYNQSDDYVATVLGLAATYAAGGGGAGATGPTVPGYSAQLTPTSGTLATTAIPPADPGTPAGVVTQPSNPTSSDPAPSSSSPTSTPTSPSGPTTSPDAPTTAPTTDSPASPTPSDSPPPPTSDAPTTGPASPPSSSPAPPSPTPSSPAPSTSVAGSPSPAAS